MISIPLLFLPGGQNWQQGDSSGAEAREGLQLPAQHLPAVCAVLGDRNGA